MKEGAINHRQTWIRWEQLGVDVLKGEGCDNYINIDDSSASPRARYNRRQNTIIYPK